MTDSRDTGAPPIKVTTAEEYDQHYMPYEVMPERDVGTMLKRVEEVLRHADRVFEYNQALFTSTDYAVLTSKYQNYLAELAEEKRLRQKPIDDIVAQSPILSVLYAIKERGLDRATALLRNVELFQSEILAAIQPTGVPEPSGSVNFQPSEIVGPEPLEERRSLAPTHSQQLTPVAGPGSGAAGPSTVASSAYRRKIIYGDAGRKVEVVDAPLRVLNSDEENQEIGRYSPARR